ncbi:MAG: hypothetical protein E1N59_2883 [Puniceicoccaceae bacterium 5H]|nr:MAG: hypothetical protein E1N59_2883 [Puniceicoccaceae bacterium 5H]
MELGLRLLAVVLMLSPTWAFALDEALFEASFDGLNWGLVGLGLALFTVMFLHKSVRMRVWIALALLLVGLLQIGLIGTLVLDQQLV